MVILDDNDDKLKIANKNNITDIVGKHNETDIDELKKVNQKLDKIKEYNLIINKLINQKTKKYIYDLDKYGIYENTQDLMVELQELSKARKKSKEETLRLINENENLIKNIEKNKYNTYDYIYIKEKGSIEKKPKDMDFIFYKIKTKAGNQKYLLDDVNTVCKNIIKVNKFNKHKIYFLSKMQTNPESKGYPTEHMNIVLNYIDKKTPGYKAFLDTLIKKYTYNFLSINPNKNNTFFNFPLVNEPDWKKYEIMIKNVIKMIEESYDFIKDWIASSYKEVKDKTGQNIDISTKEKFLASLLNLLSDGNLKTNISHNIAMFLNKKNYKSIVPIIQFLYDKGLHLNKVKLNKSNQAIDNTSFIDLASKKDLEITIKDNKIDIKPNEE